METQQQSLVQDEVLPCSTAEAGTDSQKTSGTAPEDPVGSVPILSQSRPPFFTHICHSQSRNSGFDGHRPALLPVSSSPRAARTAPIKTGGRVLVLDHSRWTEPVRAAIDGLLIKQHGAKDLLKQVDTDYAAIGAQGMH